MIYRSFAPSPRFRVAQVKWNQTSTALFQAKQLLRQIHLRHSHPKSLLCWKHWPEFPHNLYNSTHGKDSDSASNSFKLLYQHLGQSSSYAHVGHLTCQIQVLEALCRVHSKSHSGKSLHLGLVIDIRPVVSKVRCHTGNLNLKFWGILKNLKKFPCLCISPPQFTN